MLWKLTILFCITLYTTEIVATFDIKHFLEVLEQNVTRVRTEEERAKRWKEFPVLDFIGLVEKYDGYTAEEYDVETEDGYILKLHRISGSPLSPKAPGKPVVLMQHGLVGSTDFFVALGPRQALAFQLADAGYDVWLGNVRGNTYSRRHVRYSSAGNSFKFWNFSLDEMGTIDIAKFIDVVLEKTNSTKLTYIGYSMGTTLSYILLSERPEYNDKINLDISIGPSSYFKRPYSNPLQLFLSWGPIIKNIAVSNRIYQILPQSKLIFIFGKDICATHSGKQFCGLLLRSLANQLNLSQLSTLLSYTPAGASLNTIDHYYQMVNTESLRKYDFGTVGNKLKYGASVPPKYNLSKITAPQAIFYSAEDVFVNEKGAQKLKKKLKNVVAFEKVPKGINHLDFMWANAAKSMLYNRILEVMKDNL